MSLSDDSQTSEKRNYRIIIPAFNPSERLVGFVSELTNNGLSAVVIDDGSHCDIKSIFEKIESNPHCVVLRHNENLGKGAALKTAFQYITERSDCILGVVTADADGQHSVDDIVRVLEELKKTNDSVILGSRSFRAKDVPLRSKFGNYITRFFLWLVTGLSLPDTQTGLRGIGIKHLRKIVGISTNGYDYELSMLLSFHKHKVPIKCIRIKTIYIDDNQSSHFRPIIDSLSIYMVLIRFCSSSLIAALLDNIAFAVAYYMTYNILVSIFIARFISSGINFYINKSVVFRTSRTVKATLTSYMQYMLLVVVLALVSGVFVENIESIFGFNVFLTKILTEAVLFYTSFKVQKMFIFNREYRLDPNSK